MNDEPEYATPLTEEQAREAQKSIIERLLHTAWIATDGDQWAVIVPAPSGEEDDWMLYQEEVTAFLRGEGD